VLDGPLALHFSYNAFAINAYLVVRPSVGARLGRGATEIDISPFAGALELDADSAPKLAKMLGKAAKAAKATKGPKASGGGEAAAGKQAEAGKRARAAEATGVNIYICIYIYIYIYIHIYIYIARAPPPLAVGDRLVEAL